MKIDWAPVSGRSDEVRIAALMELIVDTDKPHPLAVPTVALYGELTDLGEDSRVVGTFDNLYPTDEGWIIRLRLIEGEDEEGIALNQAAFAILGMGVGSSYITHLSGVERHSFVGWSLHFLDPDDRKRVAEEQSA